MASVSVHGPAMSTAVARVLACLLEKDVDFQLVRVDMAKGEHKSPEHLRLQPFGKVPAFRDGEVTLFESRAICRYICERYAERGTPGLHGAGVLERASIEQWLEAEAQSFHPPSSALVLQLALAPRMGMKQDPVVIEQSEAKLEKVLDVYERRLGESRFLAGDHFTLADLSHLPNAQYLVAATDRGSLVLSRKNLRRWWEEISGRPAWKKVLDLQNAPLPASA